MMEDEIRSKAKQQLLIKLKVPKLEREEEEEEDGEEEEDEELEEGEIKEDHRHDDDDDVGAVGGVRTSSELIEQQPIDNSSSKFYDKNSKVLLQGSEAADQNGTSGGTATIRVCPECFKEFSSGKALGGHMRIHAQQHPQQKKCSNNNKMIKSSDHHVHKKTIHNHHTIKGHDQKHRHQTSSYYTSCHDDNGRPYCNLCGKNFPSLKSLFGHMRCHPEREWRGILPPSVPVKVHQRHKNNDQINHHRKAASLVQYSSSLSDDDSRSRSDKNEEDCDYGYNSVDMRGAVVGLSNGDLPRWAVRAKRGRKGPVSTPEISAGSEWEREEDGEEDEDEEEIRDAVEDLMRLAQGDHKSFDESGLTGHKQRVDDFGATNSNSLTDKAGGLDGNSAGSKEGNFGHANRNMDHKGKGKVGMEMVPQNPLKLEYGHKKNLSDHEDGQDDDDESDSNEQPLINFKYNSSNTNCGSTNNGSRTAMNNNISFSNNSTPCKRKRKKMKLMMDLESDHHLDFSPTTSPAQARDKTLQVVSPDKYKCSTCNKSFPTHQALGGHRSSHNKFKITVLNAVVQDGDGGYHIRQPTVNQQLVAVDENIVKESETVLAAHSGSTHQCKICNKIFPTGQALGGHKRCHWTGPAEQGQSSQMTSPGEASQTQTPAGSQKVRDFDLNEPPPMEDEAAGCGHVFHASSSSNNSSIG